MRYNLSTSDKLKFDLRVNLLKQKGAVVELAEVKEQRNLRQNAAIHLYCEMIAETLNETGATFDFKGIKGISIEIPYTMELIKETMWRPIQIALFGKKSTTELNKSEVSEIAQPIEMYFSKQGIDIPFPSLDNL